MKTCVLNEESIQLPQNLVNQKNENLLYFLQSFLSSCQMAENYFHCQYYSKALEACDTVLAFQPNNQRILFIKVKCLEELNSFEDALVYSDKLNIDKAEKEKFQKVLINKMQNASGIFDFKDMMKQEKEKFFLDIAEFQNQKLRLENDPKKGVKMVADAKISKGELLIVSKAIAAFPLINVSSPDLSEKVISIEALVQEIERKISYNYEKYKMFFSLYDEQNLNVPYESREKNMKRIYNIVKSNSIVTSRCVFNEHKVAYGTWIFPSFINHSCVPNAFYHGIGDCIIISAQKAIKKGEEVTISYSSCLDEFETRQQKLKETWGFTCECKLCCYEKDALRNSQAKREFNDYLKILSYDFEPSTDFSFFPNFIEKNKSRLSWYEASVGYYIYGYIFEEINIEESIISMSKSVSYTQGRLFNLESVILVNLAKNLKKVGNKKMYIKILQKIYGTLFEYIVHDKKYIEILLKEGGLGFT